MTRTTDGAVTAWGDKSVANVLLIPLVAAIWALGGFIAAWAISRTHTAGDPYPDGAFPSLGSVVAHSAERQLIAQVVAWFSIGMTAAHCIMVIHQWSTRYGGVEPAWARGIVVLAVIPLVWVLGRRLGPMVNRELSSLGVATGAATDQELHARRFLGLLKRPAPVSSSTDRTGSVAWASHSQRPGQGLLPYWPTAMIVVVGVTNLISGFNGL